MARYEDDLRYQPVCVIGDSIVAGLGDRTGLGWTARVAAAAWHAGRPVHLSVLGIPGDTSEMVAERWDEVRRRLDHWPDLAVVAGFGSNDVMDPGDGPRVSPDHTVTALRSIVAATPPGRLALVGPPPVEWETVNGRISERSELLGRECADLGVPFLPTYPALAADPVWRSEVAARDGAHPDAAGYAALARVVAPALLEWFSGLRPAAG